jgi:hypothetical protein
MTSDTSTALFRQVTNIFGEIDGRLSDLSKDVRKELNPKIQDFQIHMETLQTYVECREQSRKCLELTIENLKNEIEILRENNVFKKRKRVQTEYKSENEAEFDEKKLKDEWAANVLKGMRAEEMVITAKFNRKTEVPYEIQSANTPAAGFPEHRKGRFSSSAVSILKNWLFQHRLDPYPTGGLLNLSNNDIRERESSIVSTNESDFNPIKRLVYKFKKEIAFENEQRTK